MVTDLARNEKGGIEEVGRAVEKSFDRVHGTYYDGSGKAGEWNWLWFLIRLLYHIS